MHFLKSKSVKQKVHEAGKQITKDGLHAIDTAVDTFIGKLIRQHNGSSKRIDSGLVSCFKI